MQMCAQRSPVIFNIFMNDVFWTIRDGELFNYADNNSVGLLNPS